MTGLNTIRCGKNVHGFGSHTYSFINADNKRTWVKFHLQTLQGIMNLTDEEAEAVIAKDRESHQRDLYEAIERGDFPRWKMQVQLMTEDQAKEYNVNPFDLTKVWYHGDFPLTDVGILELNRNPENYFAEVEQSAFNPMNVIEGPLLSAYFRLLCASSTTSPYPLPRRLLCLLWCPGVISASSRDIPLWDLF